MPGLSANLNLNYHHNMTHELMLICGGAWSGKTARAVSLASAHPNVTWLGTASDALPMIKERVDALRAERPRHWRHIEAPFDLAEAVTKEHLEDHNSLLVIDSLSQWISNEIAKRSSRMDERQLLDTMHRDIDDFVSVITKCLAKRPVIVVSADFGQSMPPQIAADRTLRMCVGTSNTRLANISAAMEVVFAGVVIYTKPPKLSNR